MIPALYRGSLGLAAIAAILAVLSPGEPARLWAGVAVLAGLAAAALRHLLSRAQAPVPFDDSSAPAALAIDSAMLADTSALIRQRCADADGLEAALHDTARILKGEWGAGQATVYRVRRGDNAPWQVTELIAAPQGARGPNRHLGADAGALTEAIEHQREVVALPAAIVIPVVGKGITVAAIELGDIEIAIDALALGQALDTIRAALAEVASRTSVDAQAASRILPERQVLLVVERPAAATELAAALRALGCQVGIACGPDRGLQALHETQFDAVIVDAGAAEPATLGAWGAWCRAARETQRGPRAGPLILVTDDGSIGHESQFADLGFDGLIRKPLRPDSLLSMLTRNPRPHVPAPDQGSGATGGVAATVLDAAALARLAELDPAGSTRLLPRVLTAYTNSVARLRPQLLAAIPGLDLAAIRHVAHTLKSSSASIGAIKLAAMCAEIDTMIRTGATADLHPHLDSMCIELENVLQAVKQLLDGHP